MVQINNQSKKQQILKEIKIIFQNLGLGTRIWLILSFIFKICFMTQNLIFFPNLFTIQNWTISLLFNSLVSYGFINFIIQYYILIVQSYQTESKLGTAKWIYQIFLFSCILGVLHLVLYLLNFQKIFQGIYICSIWPIFMINLSFNCFQNPHEKQQLFFFQVQIKKFLIPFIILGVVILLSYGNVLLSDVTSILIGYVLNVLNKKQIKYEPNQETFCYIDEKLQCLTKFNYIKTLSEQPQFDANKNFVQIGKIIQSSMIKFYDEKVKKSKTKVKQQYEEQNSEVQSLEQISTEKETIDIMSDQDIEIQIEERDEELIDQKQEQKNVEKNEQQKKKEEIDEDIFAIQLKDNNYQKIQQKSLFNKQYLI